MADNKNGTEGSIEAPSQIKHEIIELRADLINLQKFAGGALSHLEMVLQALEKQETHSH